MSDVFTVHINGEPVAVSSGTMVSTAVAAAGVDSFRRSVTGQPRGPLCGMGVCFECRVRIGGRQLVRSCQTPCASGMEVSTDE